MAIFKQSLLLRSDSGLFPASCLTSPIRDHERQDLQGRIESQGALLKDGCAEYYKIFLGWHGGAHLIPAPKRQRQADGSEFKTGLIYRVSSGTATAAEKSCLKTQHQKPQNKKQMLLF